MARLFVCAVALLACASAVAAISLPGDCSSGSTPTIGACIKGSTNSGAKSLLKFTLTPSQVDSNAGTKKLQILFWNIQQTSSGWNDNPNTYTKLQTPASDQGSNTPATDSFGRVISGTTTGSSPAATTMGLVTYVATTGGDSSLCPGTYTIRVDRTSASNTMEWAVYMRWVDVDPAKVWLANGESYTFTNMILPGDANSVYIKGDFNTIGYTVKTLSAKITPNSAAGVDKWSFSLVSGGGGSINTKTITKTLDLPTIEFSSDTNLRPTPGTARWTFTAPTLTTGNFATGYNWQSNGPFIPVTFAVTAVTPWDSYASSVSGTIDLSNVPTDDNQHVYMMAAPSPYWWKMAIESISVTDTAATPDVANSPLTIKWASASSLTADPTSAGSYGSTYDTTEGAAYNSAFYNSGSTTKVSTKFFGAGMRTTMEPLFFYVARSSCDGTKKLSYSLSAPAVTLLPGECTSYTACNPTSGDHPSADREEFSANGDAKRFQHCALTTTFTPSGKGYMQTPSTKCIECTSDCDCGEGQYCYTDDGVCQVTTSAGGQSRFVCDPWANQRWGLCVKKSTDILGSKCRTDTANPLGSTTALYTGSTPPTTNLPVMAEAEVKIAGVGGVEESDDVSRNDDITGYGFCGEVRYYNASAAEAGWNLKLDKMVRSVSWRGRCFNHKCYECQSKSILTTPSATYTSCATGRVCLNGKLYDNKVNDFLPRTFKQNSIAGTVLGAVFMIILLQLLVCIHICVTASKHGMKMPERFRKTQANISDNPVTAADEATKV